MKKFKTSTLSSPSGASLAIYHMSAGKNAKATLQINHGMSEHSARYERFANVLVESGYHVIAHDHRGHGKTTAEDAPQGTFAKTGGWDKVISDVDAMNTHAKELHADTPVVLFGHSMGSIIGLNYCIRHSDRIAGAALWNSGVDGGLLLKVYGLLLSVERLFKGSDVPSMIAKKLAFEDWNKKFRPNRTESDWLSRDESEVDKYIADPLCGFDATNGLWTDLVIGIRDGGDDQELARIRKDLPMHLLSGGKDPCSDNGRAVERVFDRLKALDVKDAMHAKYPENRHEALNELNRDEVMEQFVDWLDERFAK